MLRLSHTGLMVMSLLVVTTAWLFIALFKPIYIKSGAKLRKIFETTKFFRRVLCSFWGVTKIWH
jgi:hypothetical protein